jgi:hypothetical protein
MMTASEICFELLMHAVACPLSFALLNAGRSIAARIAMMAMTTKSSISVKPVLIKIRRPAFALLRARIRIGVDIAFGIARMLPALA